LVKRWLPGEPVTEQSMAEAMWLEKSYWQNMSSAVANGIGKAFKS